MKLGRLEDVDVREIWNHEAHDFTPWLLEHEDDLAETLGVDLELERSEHPVGGFSLDLIGRDLTNDCVLMVENQLERTDHSHLGQILTYAAGTDASSIVWIATSFREEHRQAIDWLNEQTREDVRFFGIELQAVRIGASLAAPLFKLVAQPNNWQKQVRSGTRPGKIGSRALAYQAFWAKYLERLREEHPDWSRARTPGTGSWMDFRSSIRATSINVGFARGNRLRNEIYIDTGDATRNDRIFERLLEQRKSSRQSLGGPSCGRNFPKRNPAVSRTTETEGASLSKTNTMDTSPGSLTRVVVCAKPLQQSTQTSIDFEEGDRSCVAMIRIIRVEHKCGDLTELVSSG